MALRGAGGRGGGRGLRPDGLAGGEAPAGEARRGRPARRRARPRARGPRLPRRGARRAPHEPRPVHHERPGAERHRGRLDLGRAPATARAAGSAPAPGGGGRAPDPQHRGAGRGWPPPRLPGDLLPDPVFREGEPGRGRRHGRVRYHGAQAHRSAAARQRGTVPHADGSLGRHRVDRRSRRVLRPAPGRMVRVHRARARALCRRRLARRRPSGRPRHHRRGLEDGRSGPLALHRRAPPAPGRRAVAPHGGVSRPDPGRGGPGQGMGRPAHRHHRAQAGRAGTVRRQGGGRERQPRQERVPGQHEPRAAHAAVRRDRLQRDDGGGAGGRRAGRAAGRPAQDRIQRPPPAQPHQRRARPFQDRGEPHGHLCGDRGCRGAVLRRGLDRRGAREEQGPMRWRSTSPPTWAPCAPMP